MKYPEIQQFPEYRHAIDEMLHSCQHDPDILAIMLQGSVARGDAERGSDLDFFALLAESHQRPGLRTWSHELLVECHYADTATIQQKFHTRPMLLYGFCDAIILYDTHNALSMLCEEARHLLAMYQPELQEVQGIRYWLASVRVKLRAALNAGNLTKAAFVSTTASWPLMQGLWMVNRLPIPPGGAALAYLSRLQQLPPRFQEQFQLLLMGDGHHRIHATVDLLDWVLDQFAELPD